MRISGLITGLLIILAAISLKPSLARAATISISEKVVVQAVVPPSQYILIDSKNNILEIGSNTNQDVTPKVFLNNAAPNNERPLSDNIYSRYLRLNPLGKSHTGIIYKYYPVQIHQTYSLNLLKLDI